MAKDREKLERHIVQWMHNRLLISSIPASHPDWIVTVVFYTAVHAVDTALANEGCSVASHDERFRAIGAINRMKKIRELYHPLYNLSRTARYTAEPDKWLPPAKIELEVVRKLLVPLEVSVMGLIKKQIELPAVDLSGLAKPPLVQATAAVAPGAAHPTERQ